MVYVFSACEGFVCYRDLLTLKNLPQNSRLPRHPEFLGGLSTV